MLRRSLLSPVLVVGLVVGPVAGLGTLLGTVIACDGPPAATGCAGGCAENAPACNNGCPVIVDELCIEAACVARGDDVVDLAINVNLGRDLPGVTALAIAVVDARGTSCADVGPAHAAANVLAGNRKEVSGGTFHPDLRVGLVPEGPVLVVVDALDAAFDASASSRAVVATGCVAIDASGTAGTVTVDVPAL